MGKECSPPLKKSKSMCDVSYKVRDVGVDFNKEEDICHKRQLSRSFSNSSAELAVDSDCEGAAQAQALLTDSGLADQTTLDGHAILVLEHKIDRLSDMFQEQCRLLTILKEDIRNSKAAVERMAQYQTDIVADFVRKTVLQSDVNERDETADTEWNSRARSLLDAIESRQSSPAVDRVIRDGLANFLQSDELKEHMVAATAQSVRSVIGDCMSRDFSALYLPMLDHSHRRIVQTVGKIVEDAFVELEANSASLSRSIYKISRSLRNSMERHQRLLETAADPNKNLMATFKCTVEELLHTELKRWRQKILDVFTGVQKEHYESPEESIPLVTAPPGPLQPADSDRSIIDKLMMSAKIAQQIEAGEVNGALEVALSAADVALVWEACQRAATAAFAPRCRLHQHVLLALLQQLSTDMLHDTDLKCRYLEDSIINLDLCNAVTRSHLPLVVGEVRKHLSNFLSSYPSHVSRRRIALIIMAANNLLK